MIYRILILVGILLAHPVWADRVALVIGNADYEQVTRLANPLNDAKDIGDALERLRFKVTRLKNTNYDAMRKGLQAFRRDAKGADLAVVFYAGHGIEVNKNNFLIPVDAELLTNEDIEDEAIPLDRVTRALEGVKGLGLVILDACRDNPFAKSMEKTDGNRSIGRGLARVEPSGPNMVIAYAATEGTTASDGDGTERNSPYTKALLSHLEEPGLEINKVFRKVSASVKESTKGMQEPVYYGSFPKERIFLAGRPPEGQPSPTQPNSDTRLLADSLYWERIKDSDEPSDFEDYLGKYPNGEFAKFAREELSHAKAVARGAHRGRELLSEYGGEAMHWAARDNDIDVLRWLKAQGADTNARDRFGNTPMHEAAFENTVEALEWLKAQGADVNAQDIVGHTPMHMAARGDAVAALEWLKAQGADINVRRSDGDTPMHRAARGDAVAALEWLKAQGADINARSNNDRTPMHTAAWSNAVEGMEWLKAQGADVNARDNNGETPMHYAAWDYAVDAMKWLKAQGADVNAPDKYGNTPMHRAARGDYVAAMKWLKAQGADVNAQDNGGETPMHSAAENNAVDAMEWLKAQGADVNAWDVLGRTPMSYAEEDDDAFEWLRANGGRE